MKRFLLCFVLLNKAILGTRAYGFKKLPSRYEKYEAINSRTRFHRTANSAIEKKQPIRSLQNDVISRVRETRGGSTVLNMLPISSNPGLGSAIISPISSALGFSLWDKVWVGSTFSLNLMNNFFATIFFMIATIISCQKQNISWPVLADLTPFVLPLAFSSFLGVVLGDFIAFNALRMLGSGRFILMDCFKPVLSVLIGFLAFGEKISLKGSLGISLIIFGVYTAATTSQDQDSSSTASSDTEFHPQLIKGYLCAFTRLIFFTAGAVVTKKCIAASKVRESLTLTPALVGLLRFGSGFIMLLAIQLLGKLSSLFKPSSSPSTLMNSDWWSIPKTVSKDDTEANLSEYENKFMTMAKWKLIFFGSFFIVFLGPSLFYHSLQHTSLGIVVTLSCTGPLYVPFIRKFRKGTKIDIKEILACLISVFGVSLICIQ